MLRLNAYLIGGMIFIVSLFIACQQSYKYGQLSKMEEYNALERRKTEEIVRITREKQREIDRISRDYHTQIQSLQADTSATISRLTADNKRLYVRLKSHNAPSKGTHRPVVVNRAELDESTARDLIAITTRGDKWIKALQDTLKQCTGGKDEKDKDKE